MQDDYAGYAVSPQRRAPAGGVANKVTQIAFQWKSVRVDRELRKKLSFEAILLTKPNNATIKNTGGESRVVAFTYNKYCGLASAYLLVSSME